MFEKTKSKRGFTLAELLIVVAIIAVLVAIAIPVFTASLDKSRAATWEANARSVHADGVVQYLTAAQQPDGEYTLSAELSGLTYNWSYDTSDDAATVAVSGTGFNPSIAAQYCGTWDATNSVFSFVITGGEVVPPTP